MSFHSSAQQSRKFLQSWKFSGLFWLPLQTLIPSISSDLEWLAADRSTEISPAGMEGQEGMYGPWKTLWGPSGSHYIHRMQLGPSSGEGNQSKQKKRGGAFPLVWLNLESKFSFAEWTYAPVCSLLKLSDASAVRMLKISWFLLQSKDPLIAPLSSQPSLPHCMVVPGNTGMIVFTHNSNDLGMSAEPIGTCHHMVPLDTYICGKGDGEVCWWSADGMVLPRCGSCSWKSCIWLCNRWWGSSRWCIQEDHLGSQGVLTFWIHLHTKLTTNVMTRQVINAFTDTFTFAGN